MDASRPARVPFDTLWHGLAHNPVALKELRGRMRGRRAFVILTFYLSASAIVVGLSYASATSRGSALDADTMAQAGRSIFSAILVVQFLAALVFGPLGLAGAISGERERQTWELLRSTLLSTHAIIVGKLLSGLAYVFLLIFSAVPLQAIAFLLGGVSLTQLLLTQGVLLITAVSFGLIALVFSTRFRMVQVATTAALTVCLVLIVGGPFLLVVADGLGWTPGGRFLMDAELILATTNPAGVLANIMSPYPTHGRTVPTVGYTLLSLATINLLYLAVWHRLQEPTDL